MHRRRFLFTGASFVAGSVLGLNGFSRAIAQPKKDNPASHPPRMSLIIDDIGFSSRRTRDFLKLGVPLTFSVLPCLRKSRDLAFEIHESGHEVMLHQPMEPYSSQVDPGPGALYQGFPEERIRGIIEKNIHSVPFAAGVNNHMGSKFTECSKEVNDVMQVIRGQGLFFVDSLTSSHSTAYETARRLNMPTACRNRFLDNDCSESAICLQLVKLMENAVTHGHSIGIGHPHPETANAIREVMDDYHKSGVSLVPVSRILTDHLPADKKGMAPSLYGDFT